MRRIRIDTDELKAKAADFESAAENIANAGDELLTVAMGLPSYEGQLSTPARAAGYEIQRRSREVQRDLADDAQTLKALAQVFEQVDGRTASGILQYQESLPWYFDPYRGVEAGTSYLGYRDDGLGDTVILCMYGVCRWVNRTGNEAAIQEFEKNVDIFENAKETRDSAIGELCALGLLAVAGLLAVETIIGAIAAMGAIGRQAVVLGKVEKAKKDMADATYGAAYYWNIIFGDTLTGDDTQGLFQDPESNMDIYFPLVEVSS